MINIESLNKNSSPMYAYQSMIHIYLEQLDHVEKCMRPEFLAFLASEVVYQRAINTWGKLRTDQEGRAAARELAESVFGGIGYSAGCELEVEDKIGQQPNMFLGKNKLQVIDIQKQAGYMRFFFQPTEEDKLERAVISLN